MFNGPYITEIILNIIIYNFVTLFGGGTGQTQKVYFVWPSVQTTCLA